MILFNKTWNNEVLSRSLLDIVQPSVDPNVYCGECGPGTPDGITAHNLVDNICPISLQSSWTNPAAAPGTFENFSSSIHVRAIDPIAVVNAYKSQNRIRLENFSIVTEKFLKTLDKFYKKLYNEDFTTNVFYGQHIVSIFQGLASPTYLMSDSNFIDSLKLLDKNAGNVQLNRLKPLKGNTYEPKVTQISNKDFKIVIDRMISLGLMDEEDRLDIKDQCFLYDLKRTDVQIIDNKSEKTIDIICNKISDIIPDIKTENLASLEGVDQTGPGQSLEHSFHKDKRLFLMWTPYLKNEATVKYGNTFSCYTPEEPTSMQVYLKGNYSGYVGNTNYDLHFGTSHEPVSYFKPKKYQTRFNKGSMPMATHLIWRIGTQDTRETAINGASPFIPEVIFDHVDRISHIDNFKLRIKYNTVRF